MKRILFLLACATVMMLPCQAQRLIPKQQGIEIVGGLPIIQGEKLFQNGNFDIGMSFIRHLKSENYAFLSAEYEQQYIPYRRYDILMKDAILQVGYMHPVLSDMGKNIFAYLGVSALSGYEDIGQGSDLLPDGAKLLDRSRFVYGGAVHLSVEIFLSDHVLFLIKNQGRMLLGSDLNIFRPAISAGFRINL